MQIVNFLLNEALLLTIYIACRNMSVNREFRARFCEFKHTDAPEVINLKSVTDAFIEINRSRNINDDV
jgi:hypothetical protein